MKKEYVIYYNNEPVTCEFSVEEQQLILAEHHLYENKNYCKLIETFPEYESYILALDKYLSSTYFSGRIDKWIWDNYSSELLNNAEPFISQPCEIMIIHFADAGIFYNMSNYIMLGMKTANFC